MKTNNKNSRKHGKQGDTWKNNGLKKKTWKSKETTRENTNRNKNGNRNRIGIG